MKWKDVRVGDVFSTKMFKNDPTTNDVWIVLSVAPSEEGSIFVSIRYAYLHQLGEPDAVSEWNAIAENPTNEYELIS